MLQIVALVWLALCWVAWSLAFIKPRKQAAGQKKVVRAPASKWGIILVMIGFALVWAYVRPVGFEKSAPSLIASMILGPPSVALGWAKNYLTLQSCDVGGDAKKTTPQGGIEAATSTPRTS
jgi:hypothetical protein